MTDHGKTRDQLLAELDAARKRIAVLEQAQTPSAGSSMKCFVAEYFHAAEDPASFLDSNYTYQTVNAAYSRYFGQPVEEIVGSTVAELLGEKLFQSSIKPHLDRCLAGEQVSYKEWVTFPALGRRFMHVSYYPNRDSQGKIIGILHISHDQTEHKLRDMEMQQERNKLSSILASLNTGLSVINPDLTVDWVNYQTRRMFPDGNPIGKVCHEFYEDLQAPCKDCPTIKVFETGEAQHLERYNSKDDRWYSVLAQPILDASGMVVKVLEGITDITERKRSEEALHKSESKWRHILISAPHIGISLDPNGIITFANEHFLKLIGWSSEEVIGRNWFDTFIPSGIREQIRRVFVSVMTQKHTHGYSNYENDILHRNGDRLTVSWSNVLTLDPRGYPIDVTCMGIDVTERRRAERALNNAHKTLRAILESLPAHVYVADLNTHEVLYLNEAMREAFGQDCLGRRCFDVFKGLGEPCSNCTNASLLDEDGEPAGLQVWEGINPLTERWYVNHDQAVRWVDGRLAHIQIAIDITQRKRSEESLRESEERFKALHNASFGGIAIHDKGVILECNLGLSTMTGYEIDELIGMDGLLLIAEQSRALVMQNILAGYEKPYEALGVRKNGEEYALRLEARNIPYKSKQVRVVEFRDITEQKNLENILTFLAKSTANPASDDFFQEMARFISETLAMEFVCIDRLDGDTLTAHTLAVYSDGKFEDNVSYALKDTPCGEVVGKHVCCFPKSVKKLFPNDAVLQQMQAESYIGVTLWSHDGRPIGLIAVIGTQPISNQEHAESLLSLVGVRAAAELERKQIEDGLRKSEEKHRRLFETMIQGVIYQTPDGSIISANSAAERILGLTIDQLRGKTSMDPRWRMIEEDGTEVSGTDHPAMIAMKTGKTIGPVMRGIFHPDKNAHIWLSITAIPLFQSGETTPFQVYATFEDVTERRSALAALRETEERLRLANKATNDVIWDWDVVRDSQQWNEAGIAVFGWTEIVEHPVDAQWWVKRVHPDDRKRVHDSFFAVVSNPALNTWHDEYRFLKADGSYAYVLDRGYVLRDARGSAVRMIGAMLDITERTRAHEHLLKYKQIVSCTIDGISLVDKNYRYVIVNKAYENYSAKSENELTGLSVAEYLGEETFNSYIKPKFDKCLTGETVKYQSWFEYPTIGRRFVEVSYSPYINSLGEISGIVANTRDITDQKLAEEALLTAKVQAEAANRAKSEFLANMSHELRTPLNGIMGMLQLLKVTELNGEQDEYIAMALLSCRRLTNLLTDILDLSRIEAGKLRIIAAPLCLSDIVRQLQDLFFPSIKQTGVALEFYLAPDIPAQLVGDTTRLQQVLINLVGNALKFTPTGSVSVEAYPLPARRPGEYRVLFCVADTGIGIPDDKLDTLFLPFSQVSEGYRRTHQGAGLGLSICKRLVDLMGGNIAVESELGVGTTVYFCVTLGLEPAAADAQAETQVSATVSQVPAFAALRVLVAEDDRVSGIIATKLLSKAGFTVKVVEDGEQALDALRQEHFDLVLMDVQMPVMDGVEATRAIRNGDAGSDKKNIPIIALTSYAMAGDREKFLEAGMNGYLSKPTKIDDLISTIKSIELRRTTTY